MINFVEAGGTPNDPSEGADNLALLHDLIAGTTVTNLHNAEVYGGAHGPAGAIHATGGPRIYFPPGVYHFSGPIRLRKAVHLMGSDGASRAAHNTIFRFPPDTQGLVADSNNTDNLSYVAPGSQQPSANGSVIEGIMFSGANTARNDKHGLLIRCYVTLKNVGADQFGGHGIYVFADSPIENPRGGQASNSLILACSAAGNRRSGLCIDGGDANIILVEGGDYSNNEDWGIQDLSFLGCTFTGIHMTGNGGQAGVVRYDDKAWVLRPGATNAQAGAIQPGTNENIWTRFYQDVAPTRPTWPDVSGVRSCGAFFTPGEAAESVWTGCYTEGSQSGSFVGKKTIVIGGDHGAGVYAADMGGSGEPAQLSVQGQEVVTRTSMRCKSIHLGLTRSRGERGFGMKMSAGSGPPPAAGPEMLVYSSKAFSDYVWSPGDIIWNESRAETQPGVVPPLGWRCLPGNGDPPGAFEEIPFPAAVGGTPADGSISNPKLADMVQNSLKGRAGGAGTGDPQDLTPVQARSVIASDTNDGALFLAGDGTFKAPPSGGGGWTLDYTSNRTSWYNLTPPNMTHVVFNTSDAGFHRIYLQNVATGTRVKLSRVRGGHPVEISTSDQGQILSRKGTGADPTIAEGGTVLLTKIASNLWAGEGDFA
jgi:hypothetical protein